MTQTADAGRTRLHDGPDIVDRSDELRIEPAARSAVRPPSTAARVLRPAAPGQTPRLTVVIPTRNE